MILNQKGNTMRTRITSAAYMVIALVMLGFAAPTFAQDDEPLLTPEEQGKIRERLIGRIMEKKHNKLRQVLSLDDEQAKKFFDTYTPAEKELAELIRQRTEQEMRLLKLTQGELTDGDVDPTLNNIQDLNDKIEGKVQKLNESLKPILNPRQRARLFVFEKEFNRRIREEIRERRERKKERRDLPPDGGPPRRDIPPTRGGGR
jgi:Spy/CpxP family protein refolding chaperone